MTEGGIRVLERFDLPEVFGLPGGATWNACHDDDGELSQVEGMVVDDYYGILYLGSGTGRVVGDYRVGPGANLVLVDRVREFGVPYEPAFRRRRRRNFSASSHCISIPGLGSPHIAADVEGLTIYKAGRAPGICSCRVRGPTNSRSTTARRASMSATSRSTMGSWIPGRNLTACTL